MNRTFLAGRLSLAAITTLLLIPILGLGACSSPGKPLQSQKEPSEEPTPKSALTLGQEFELKTKCAGYWDRMVKEAGDDNGITQLQELFYSPRLNTCVAAISKTISAPYEWVIQDVLSHELILNKRAASLTQ